MGDAAVRWLAHSGIGTHSVPPPAYGHRTTLLDSWTSAMTTMARSVAPDRLGDMTGITGLTGWVGIVLNAPDARALAYFYRDLLGWPLADDEPDWCTIRVPAAPANLAFQTEEIYERPTWPATSGKQQMMLHLDIGVSDLAAAVQDAVKLGACLASHQPQDDVRVLLDPAGHPFCLYID